MSTIDPTAWQRQARPIIGALRTPVIRSILQEPEPPPVVPFITISREPGAGAWQLTERLVERLNQVDPGPVPWSGWDRELVEKVAADHNLSKELVESLGQRDQNWLSDFLAGLAISDDSPSEETVFRNASTTVRALARAGRVVIVGLGGVFITQKMPGAVHVRLVAPLSYRVDLLARRRKLTREQAEAEIQRLERNRAAFFARYFPNRTLGPDMFHLTINTSRLNSEQLVEVIVPLVKHHPAVTRRQAEAQRTG